MKPEIENEIPKINNDFNFLTAERAFADVYLQFPKVLINGSKYSKLSDSAKIAYMVFKDRTEYSREKNWIDQEGYIYFIFTIDEICTMLGKSKTTAIKIKKELEKANLLKQVNMGFNKQKRKQNPNRLYLADLEVSRSDLYNFNQHTEMGENINSIPTDLNPKTTTNVDMSEGIETRPSETSEGINSIPTDFGNQHPTNVDMSEGINSIPSEASEGIEPRQELYNISKDFKEFKESKTTLSIIDENFFFEESIKKSDGHKELDQMLIDEIIVNKALNDIYGEGIISLMKIYSFGSLETFELYLNKLTFACREIEKESGHAIHSMGNVYLHDELRKTFLSVVKKEKDGLIKTSFAGYLFTALKSTFNLFAI